MTFTVKNTITNADVTCSTLQLTEEASLKSTDFKQQQVKL